MGRLWGRNNHEAGSSRRRAPAPPPPPSPRSRATATPPPPAPATAPAFRLGPPATRRARQRVYVNRETFQWYWDNAIPVPWPDVHLFEGWHLNPERIPVPPVPREGLEREVEILRRREALPEDLRGHAAFAVNSSYWDTWFTDEHDLRRRSYFGARSTRGEARLPPPSPQGVIKEEAPPVVTEDGEEYDEEAALAAALETTAREAAEAAAEEAREAAAAVAAHKAREAQEAAREGMGETPPPDWFMPLVGMSWEWTGPPPELPPPAPQQPPTPPRESGLPAHLVQDPDYIILE